MSNWANMDDDDNTTAQNEYKRVVDGDVITESYIRSEVNDEDGTIARVRVTKKFRENTKSMRVNKMVQARRKWAKFGDCAGLAPGPEMNITYMQPDPVQLEFLQPESKAKAKDDVKITTVCRKCGESGHWTLQCKNFAVSEEGDTAIRPVRPNALGGMNAPASEGKAASSGTGKALYRPPGYGGRPSEGSSFGGGWGGHGGGNMNFRDEVPALRVTNLSPDTTAEDLKHLFGAFGTTTRVYLAKDRATNQSRCFAFVNFQRRECAQAAIDRLNGHGYDSLILHVEWAKPREDKPASNDAVARADRKSVV